MKIFYMTFGQASPFKNGWVTIVADSELKARQFAKGYPHWCGLYEDEPRLDLFPSGQLGSIQL